MKKYLSILLSIVMVFNIMSITVFATENTDDTVEDGEITMTQEGVEGETTEIVDGEESTEHIHDDATENQEEEQGYLKATVVEANEPTEQPYYDMYTIKIQDVRIKMLNGKNAGEEFTSSYYLTQDHNGIFEAQALKVGDKVYVALEETPDTESGETITTAYVVQKMRDTNMLIAGLIIAALLIVFARLSGVKTIGLVVVNVAIAMAVVLGLYVNAVSPTLSLLALLIPVIIADVLIINGFKKESWVAILAVTISTVMTIGAISLLNSAFSTVGLTEYGSYLSGVDPEVLIFDYLDILVGCAMLMTIGVTIDMGLRAVRKGSQGKPFGITLKEVSKVLPNKLNNALLVWLGGFMSVFVVFYLYARPILEIINVETIVVELLKIMVIFINVILVMPIGILISKELLKTRGLTEPKKEE